MYYNMGMGKKKETRLNDFEERIAELEELYVMTRSAFLDEFDDLNAQEKERYLRQLRGMLDDIAKEAGGRVKRQEVTTNFGTKDSSFMELISGIRGNLPTPKPVIEAIPIEVTEVTDGAENSEAERA